MVRWYCKQMVTNLFALILIYVKSLQITPMEKKSNDFMLTLSQERVSVCSVQLLWVLGLSQELVSSNLTYSFSLYM